MVLHAASVGSFFWFTTWHFFCRWGPVLSWGCMHSSLGVESLSGFGAVVSAALSFYVFFLFFLDIGLLSR